MPRKEAVKVPTFSDRNRYVKTSYEGVDPSLSGHKSRPDPSFPLPWPYQIDPLAYFFNAVEIQWASKTGTQVLPFEI